MQNYYDLKKQLELCTAYLDSLKEQKELLNSFLYPKTVNFENAGIKGGKKNDPFLIYTMNLITLDKQIAIAQMEKDILQRNLKKMDEILRGIHDSTYRIFVFRYLDGLSVLDIAEKTHFSTRRVYQILNKIKRILDDERVQKISQTL